MNERVTAFRSSRWYRDNITKYTEDLKGDFTVEQIDRALLQHLKEGFVTSSDEDKQAALDEVVRLTFGEHSRYKRALTLRRTTAAGAGAGEREREENAVR